MKIKRKSRRLISEVGIGDFEKMSMAMQSKYLPTNVRIIHTQWKTMHNNYGEIIFYAYFFIGNDLIYSCGDCSNRFPMGKMKAQKLIKELEWELAIRLMRIFEVMLKNATESILEVKND